jgi:hypothetical protein
MAAFIPVPNTVEAHLRGTLNGVPVENTLYFHGSAAWSVTTMEVLAAALGLWYRTSIVAGISQEYLYRECAIGDLTVADGLQVIDNTGAGTHGGGTSPAASNQAAFCVKFSTGRRGRSYRGRNYVPAIQDAVVSGGKIESATANNLVAAYTILHGYADLFGAIWCVVSRYAAKAPRPFGISTPIVSASYTTLALASQRGRRPA